jgi:SAM-dependent methyltransferase
MSGLPGKRTFTSLYCEGQPPWDIGKPQPAFLDVADQIHGSLLDAGCGTGENALFFARQGCKVTGIDFLVEPIQQVKHKATKRGLSVTSVVKDALTLGDWSERFDNVIDSGLFHNFSNEERKRYVAGLAAVLNPGGKLFLLCCSDAEPRTQEPPRRIAQKELYAAFAKGWTIESIQPTRFVVAPYLKQFTFSMGCLGPLFCTRGFAEESLRAWFAVVLRGDNEMENG